MEITNQKAICISLGGKLRKFCNDDYPYLTSGIYYSDDFNFTFLFWGNEKNGTKNLSVKIEEENGNLIIKRIKTDLQKGDLDFYPKDKQTVEDFLFEKSHLIKN